MASWSRMMWQSVVNRAVRMLAAGPFGWHFFESKFGADVVSQECRSKKLLRDLTFQNKLPHVWSNIVEEEKESISC
ncbi:hypothetical protein KIN20_007736 [Parelaphostrongylus tenuis]|uniref:Uncharacterized protein n=1 Tax=Parelaphostrongylus tenuis TaxID=148309 RepID=A0AAD5QJD0_PARTN|nr:hypothetical protein KIN20_007736 [Parelaphostrongylus tenuis]